MTVSRADLDHILVHAASDLAELRRARIFFTGGTGYVGRWLLEGLLHAERELSLDLAITVLSRDPSSFRKSHPHLAPPGTVSFLAGDIRDFSFPEGGFSHAVHAATDVVASVPPIETFDVTVSGTRRVLEFCAGAGVTEVLLLSSGAVYGPIPHLIDRVEESHSGAPDPSLLGSAYGIGKRATEWLGTAFSVKSSLSCKSARLFAQVGPYLALDRQFAAGNFIRDAILRQPIVVRGDGTPLRSYMYAADLVVWLLAILVRGKAGRPYNVGSDVAISIADLANAVARVAAWERPIIDIRGKPKAQIPPERYVPSIARARDELGVAIYTPLEAALGRTIDWFLPQLHQAHL